MKTFRVVRTKAYFAVWNIDYITYYLMNIDFCIYILIINSYIFQINEIIRIWSSVYSIFL